MPPKRTKFAMAYDPVRQRVVLFGGVTATGQLLSDVWEWDGTTWLDRTPTKPGPQPRLDHALVYDAMNSRVVMFGGSSTFQLLNDLWAWDGSSWTQLATPLAPSPRASAALICDPVRGVLVLFGGIGNSGVELQDTWTFRQANEDELDRDTSTTAGPP
jgi:hypothetical protein